ncbi:cytochrome c biogenesis protein CcsA [Mucilaginibacter sp. UR6-11]|uniref:cytochrome c biogenesis protein CcsA n=1 Tax=Mucilaginibacter sp. UR6-11 TaxID=1435644 RepID=UPI001E47F40B|nr:cytochrome c biogenesis protein CcsA [Mucilaginibacter sp. UR6-11]MCC8423329.1 cytochrome c biogenesis protein CcsA [Mucilaginibacter sp. UR6-11]
MDTAFKGEHLLPGHLGQFFTILAFGSALFAAISYYFATTNPLDTSWKRLGRLGAYINTIAVIGIGVCLYYIILNHLFEYYYAWEHSSRALPTHYIISSFWDGQEGSFWLWTFWQAVLGNILIWKAKSWENPVMAVVSLSQAILATMLIGVDIFGQRIGTSPFILLREAIDLKANAPAFAANPALYHNYLTYIKDGNGMNPLLQNYWMVIHPPTLFLGFASMIVPFAYAIAGLWQKRYKEWIKPAIPYSLFAMMILGTGIIMGAFWAYDSLSFGGFWAWDPVENASIIPWLILVGAVHVMIVYKNTSHSYITATILVLMSFVLVLYASFLTRSGVLGDTSVHAFTDAGMFWHLVADVVIFLVLAVVMLAIRWKELPRTTKDEETYSREFWMFVGSVFLGLSCFHLVVVSSIPVWNLMFGTKLAPPSDPVKHYNIVQASFAVVVTLLTGFTQFLKYKKTDGAKFFISTLVYLLVAGLITLPIVYFTGANKLKFVFILIMVGAIYSILANGKVLIDAFKGKLKLAGSAVAHIGFGLIMVGALISAGTSKVISENTTGEQFSDDFAKSKNNPRENIILYKNKPVVMGKYTVTYIGDSVAPPNHYFKVNYRVIDANGKVTEEFLLKPNAQANAKMGLIASPDTKHYLFSDLYTHVNMSNAIEIGEGGEAAGHDEADEDKKYEAPLTYEVAVGDTIRFREGYATLTSIGRVDHLQDIALTGKDVAIGARIHIVANSKTYDAEPIYMIRNSNAFDFARKVEDAGLKLRFTKVLPQKGKVEITLYQQPESAKKWIVMRAIQFPDINFLWAGTIIMVIGILLSIFRRNKELKTT